MRHQRTHRKLGVWSSYRKMMLRNLATNLVLSGKIETTEARSKELRRMVDKIFVVAKNKDLVSQRKVYSFFTTKQAARRCMEDAKNKFDENKNGGFTRQFKVGIRRGDGAPLVLVKLDYA